jgi:hypothetical protein
MKTSSVSLCFLTATLFAAPGFAQADAPAATTPPPPAPGEHRPWREEMLQRFDANHDGQLDDAERATARAAWQKRMAERGGPGAEFHGGGHPHRHWRKMMRMRHWRRMHLRHAMLRRFDRDGDHRLSEAERADARKAGEEMRARFQANRRQMLERFDANHDGRLDENERKGVRDAWQEFVKQRPVLAPAPAAPAGK